jgi:hypothetical protein
MRKKLEKGQTEKVEGTSEHPTLQHFNEVHRDHNSNLLGICNYCAKPVKGAPVRFREHLACKRGDVEPCPNVPQAVKAAHQQLAQESIDQKQARLDKEARQAGPSSTPPSSTTAIRSQPSIAGFAVDKMKADAADFAIALAFAETATPFNVARHPAGCTGAACLHG